MKRLLYLALVAMVVISLSCVSAPSSAEGSASGGGDVLAALTPELARNVEEAFSQAEKDIKNREFKIGTPKGSIRTDSGVLLRDYSSGAIIAMRDPADWYAFALVGPVLKMFQEKGPAVMGAPVSDEFPVDGGTKQVFSKGHVMVNAGTASWTPVTFVEPPAPPANFGALMPGDEVITPLSDTKKAAMTRAFREAYRLALIRGFNPGPSSDMVHQWDGPVTQNTTKGDSYSVANTWGLPNVSVFLMPLDGRNAYIMKDIFADTYSIGRGQGANSGPFGYGSAISDEYVKDGFICQNFEKTIMQANPDGTMDIIYK